MVQEIANALTVKGMQSFVNAHSWVWPVCEMIHYTGMSLIMGIIGILDLRVLGLFRGIPAGALRPLVPLAIAGFVANVLTGIVFVTGTGSGAVFYVDNLSFQLKMLCVLLAGANLLYFHYSGLEERTYALGAGVQAPGSAKAVALFSLVMWVFIIFFGRMLMYNDTLLLFLGM
jgi:hypothetical protein